MTIDKAIELLELYEHAVKFFPRGDFLKAIQLGIEALKLIRAWRKALPLDNPQLLPGETKEE